MQRLGLWPITKKEKETISSGPPATGTSGYTTWWRKIMRLPKKQKKLVVKKDLADCHLDEEALKQVDLYPFKYGSREGKINEWLCIKP